ncbi:hypothetical protein DH2020_024274 [Rehmannia glutinosa]|uniref:PDZ domain-containing protein n=1 Tax=Rehmannia glutinosa TaxID=99300 RepID=A0ABR0WBE0_REHGL
MYYPVDTSVLVSIPSPFRASLTWPWRTIEENSPRFAFTRSNPSQYGVLPLFFSRPDAVPDPGVSKGTASDAGDSPKHSCNCLGRDTIANAAAKIGPSVVNLSVPQGFYGMTVGKSIGSGTIIDEDGTILTCAHVVVDFQGLRSSSKGKVEVTLQDGRSFEGTVVNADLHSDIAIVKIKSKTPLPAAKLGNSSKLRPGDWVLAMGCPLTLQNTITAGIVSCVDRKSSDLGLGGMHREYLQTDCAINQVSPGSPADRAGFRPGDVVVEFGGRPISSIKEVIDIMGDKIGKPFKAVVKRANNVTETLTVIPEEANPDIIELSVLTMAPRRELSVCVKTKAYHQRNMLQDRVYEL